MRRVIISEMLLTVTLQRPQMQLCKKNIILKISLRKLSFNKLNRLVWHSLVSILSCNYPKGWKINKTSFHVLIYETVPWKAREMGFPRLKKNSFPGGGRGDMPLNLISGSCLRRSIYLSLQCELPQKVRTAHLRIARDRWRESVTIADWRARSGCHSNSHNKLQIRVWLTPMRISILATNLKPSHTLNKAEFLRLLLLI